MVLSTDSCWKIAPVAAVEHLVKLKETSHRTNHRVVPIFISLSNFSWVGEGVLKKIYKRDTLKFLKC